MKNCKSAKHLNVLSISVEIYLYYDLQADVSVQLVRSKLEICRPCFNTKINFDSSILLETGWNYFLQ